VRTAEGKRRRRWEGEKRRKTQAVASRSILCPDYGVTRSRKGDKGFFQKKMLNESCTPGKILAISPSHFFRRKI
jgi:hypothetical protein